MIRVSPYTPLFFTPSKDFTGVGSRYVQTFAKADRIMLQIFAEPSDLLPAVFVRNVVTGNVENITLNRWDMNSQSILYYYVLTMLPEGYYEVSVDGQSSELFCVTEDEDLLKDTVLLQYSNRNNQNTQDAVFFIDNAQFFFDFRIPGGFKDSGWAFDVENEQFITIDGDIVNMSSFSSTQKMLTVGGGEGCPIWIGEHLNRLLCCDYVYADGTRYSRKDSNVPEVTEIIEGSRSFVFKQILQEIRFLDNSIENVNNLLFRSAEQEVRNTGRDRLRIC